MRNVTIKESSFVLVLLLTFVDINAIDIGKLVGGKSKLGKLIGRKDKNRDALVPSTGVPETKIRSHLAPIHDASTGTVTDLTDDQEIAHKSAMTCDTVMAKSLVLANEGKTLAENERDEALVAYEQKKAEAERLNEELSQTTTKLSATVEDLQNTLKLTREESLSNITKVQADASASIERIEDEMQSKEKEAAASLERAQAEWTVMHDQLKKEHEEKLTTLSKEHAESVAKIVQEKDEHVAKANLAIDEAKAKAEADVDEVKKATLSETEALKAEQKGSLEKKDMEIKAIKSEAKQKHDDLRAQSNEAMEALKEKHLEEIEQLKALVKEREEETKQEQARRKKDVEDLRETLTKSAMEELADTRSKMQAEIDSLKEAERKLDTALQNSKSDYKFLQRDFEEAKQEIQSWESLHHSRSYCNLTHIQEDSAAVLVKAAQSGSEMMLVASSQLSSATMEVAQPHLEKGRELYNAHMKQHVDKHVAPLHNRYLAPIIERSDSFLRRTLKNAVDSWKGLYSHMVRSFSSSCPEVRKSLRSHGAPEWFREAVKDSCDEPQQTINRSLWTMLFVLILIFRRLFWRVAIAAVCFPFRVLWFVLPFRFFFRKKKDTTAESRQQNGQQNGFSAGNKPKIAKSGLSQ